MEARHLSDADASKYVSGVGFHWYETWTSSVMQFQNLRFVSEAFPSKNLVFTEGCVEVFKLSRIYDWVLAKSLNYIEYGTQIGHMK